MADEVETGYTPETLEEPETPEDGVFCFLNDARICHPTCIAYNTNVPQVNTDLSPAQRRCSLLQGVDRTARHLVIIASVLASTEQRKKTEGADRKREKVSAPLVPPNPFGSRG